MPTGRSSPCKCYVKKKIVNPTLKFGVRTMSNTVYSCIFEINKMLSEGLDKKLIFR